MAIKIHHFDIIDSTNDECRRMLHSGITPPFAVLARTQSAGRGRHGRIWHSESGNLFLSLCIDPSRNMMDWPQISFIAALAVCNTTSEFTGASTEISCKWPNDVLYSGKKFCGILLETVSNNTSNVKLIIGIGMNLMYAPQSASYPATSIFAESKKIFDPTVVANSLLEKILSSIEHWGKFGFTDFRKDWLARCAHLGRQITISAEKTESGQSMTGLFLDLRDDGALLLSTNEGAVVPIFSGTVI